MYPLSDKDLDRLSREAAEQYDVEQNTSGWDKVQGKLDTEMPQKGRKERRRFIFFLWFTVALTGGGLFWMLSNPSPDQIAGRIKKSEIVAEKSPTANAGSTDKEAKVISPEQNSEGITDVAKNSPDRENNNGVITQSQASPILLSYPKRRSSQSTIRNPQSNRTRQNTFLEKVIDVSEDVSMTYNTDRSIGIITQKSRIYPIENSKADPEATIKSDPSGLKSANLDLLLAGIKKTDNITKADAATTPKKGVRKQPLEIGLMAAPDISSVNFRHTDRLGINYGLQLGYRFSSRWSVNTGVMYTKKNYESRGKDFHPPKGTWLDNVELNLVEGSCKMFDIPLNVRYDLGIRKSSRYFASAGLSTYIMKNEDYEYYYRYPNGNPGIRYRSYPSEEKYWFSVLNLSAGYEKNIGKQFSVQVEPYFKVPLKGVGFGSIQLNSYGLYLGVKYKPAFK